MKPIKEIWEKIPPFKENPFLYLGFGYVWMWTVIGILMIGKIPEPQRNPYSWDLPFYLAFIQIVPLVIGIYAGRRFRNT
jgi:hypothetical protein